MGSSAPFVAAGGALSIWPLARRGMAPSSDDYKSTRPYRLLVLGVLEALNLSLYAVSLRLSSPAVAVSLHLTTPVFLALAAIARNRSGSRIRTLVMMALILTAVAISAQSGTRAGHPRQGLGSALALGSALVVALLVTLATRTSRRVAPLRGAASQLTIAAALLTPLATTTPGLRIRDCLTATLVGVLFLGPGLALYWRAIQQLPPERTSIIGLNEAVVATTIGVVALGRRIDASSLVSTAILMSTVILAVRACPEEPRKQPP
jgi:drug/metabolite transporter (DMT)-like permease